MRFKLLPCLLAVSLLLAGCITGRPADDKVYSAERTGDEKQKIEVIDTKINTLGNKPFIEEMPRNIENSRNHLLINISLDGKTVYYMERADGIRDDKGLVIKGRDPYRMDLLRLDIETGISEVLDAGIPVISRAEWNKSGDVLALMGGNHLTLYNAETHKLIIPDKLQNEQVSYFGWGPKGKKIFTEHPNLPNGSIIYVDSSSMVHKYENDEELYYKGRLDENYFYGTYLYRPSEAELKKGVPEVPETVVIDKKGKIVKFIGEGRFRDAYGRSVLQLGENLFGLYYTSDINHTDNIIKLTDEYIYDARFIYDGKIAYIIKSPEVEKNIFLLCFADREGKLIEKLQVTGNCLVLSPDGRSAYTKGAENEEIDLSKMALKSPFTTITYSDESRPICDVIRGAADSYCKFALTGEKDLEAVRKYFIDTHDSEQWAYFDITNYMQEISPSGNVENYVFDIRIDNEYMIGDTASMNVEITGSNSFGTSFRESWAVELIKRDNRWYITGLSTFPNSEEKRIVKKLVESYIANNQLHTGLDKELSIGQIQFWQLSEPHLAIKPEHANYCKVYLKVKENGEKSIYTLVLRKDGACWMNYKLTKDKLSGLF